MSDRRGVDQILEDWHEDLGPASLAESHSKELQEDSSLTKDAMHAEAGPILNKHGFKRDGDEYIKKEKLATTTIRLYLKVDGNNDVNTDDISGEMELRVNKSWTAGGPLIGSSISLGQLDQVLQGCDDFYQEIVQLEKAYQRASKLFDKVENMVD